MEKYTHKSGCKTYEVATDLPVLWCPDCDEETEWPFDNGDEFGRCDCCGEYFKLDE